MKTTNENTSTSSKVNILSILVIFLAIGLFAGCEFRENIEASNMFLIVSLIDLIAIVFLVIFKK